MLEVESTGQQQKWQNSNKAIAGTTTEAFDMWLHSRYVFVKLSLGDILFRHTVAGIEY